MKSTNWKLGVISAATMGILTILLCLVVADGMIGLNHPPARKYIECIGAVVFWGGITALPLIIS